MTTSDNFSTTSSPPPSLPGCPDGWYLLHDTCYTLFGYGEGEQLDFRDAESVCQQKAKDYGETNGHLASIPYDGINGKNRLFKNWEKLLPWK